MSFVFIPNAGDERSLRVPTPAGRNLPRRPDRPLKNERTCHSEGRVCPRNLLFLCLFAKGESKNGSGCRTTLEGPESLTLSFQQAESQSDPGQAIRKKERASRVNRNSPYKHTTRLATFCKRDFCLANRRKHYSLKNSRRRLIWSRLTGISVCFLWFIFGM